MDNNNTFDKPSKFDYEYPIISEQYPYSTFYINSANRVEGTNTDFSYNIGFPPASRYTRCCLLQAMIPKSFYNIPSGKNTFVLKEGAFEVTITITPSNYNRKSLKIAVVALLNTNSPTGWTYAMTYPNVSTEGDTGKYTWTVSGNGGVQPSFIFSSSSTIYEGLGFASSSTNSFSSDSLSSSNVINLSHESSIYIHSDIVTNGTSDNILQDIYVADSPTFSSIQFIQQNMKTYTKRLSLNDNKSNVYKFRITDEDDNVIDTNGVNCVMTILVY